MVNEYCDIKQPEIFTKDKNLKPFHSVKRQPTKEKQSKNKTKQKRKQQRKYINQKIEPHNKKTITCDEYSRGLIFPNVADLS